MDDLTTNDQLLAASRDLREQFERVVLPHREALWRYCRLLTGSPWDGEDLFQDTMLKAFASLAQLWHPLVPKTYLFRIASNTWIDQCRRKKVPIDLTEDVAIGAPDATDPLEVEEALLTLIDRLPPKQVVVFLLMDVFGFAASDVAGMIHMVEGTAYTALHRARKRLRGMRPDDAGEVRREHATVMRPEQEASRREAVKQLVHALNTGDPSGIVRFMSDQMHNDAAPGFQEYNKADMFTGSMQGFAEGALQASVQTLWGKEVVVVYARTEAGLQLHNISDLDMDEGKLVRQKSYYFCRELLEEAASTLGVPVQLRKPAVQWA